MLQQSLSLRLGARIPIRGIGGFFSALVPQCLSPYPTQPTFPTHPTQPFRLLPFSAKLRSKIRFTLNSTSSHQAPLTKDQAITFSFFLSLPGPVRPSQAKKNKKNLKFSQKAPMGLQSP